MAGKSAIPLIAVAGAAAALLLSGKKKAAPKGNGKRELKPINWLEVTTEVGGDDRLKLDAECGAIANKINMAEHNLWLTNRYFQLLAEGMTDLDQVTLQLLIDQSDHCPWGDPEKWTPLMRSLYEQLNAGVRGWYEETGGQTFPQD